jgi:hypothetical protein
VTADVEDACAGGQELQIVGEFFGTPWSVSGSLHTGGNGFGRLLLLTLLPSISAFSPWTRSVRLAG